MHNHKVQFSDPLITYDLERILSSFFDLVASSTLLFSCEKNRVEKNGDIDKIDLGRGGGGGGGCVVIY